jgi:hypothetical protein
MGNLLGTWEYRVGKRNREPGYAISRFSERSAYTAPIADQSPHPSEKDHVVEPSGAESVVANGTRHPRVPENIEGGIDFPNKVDNLCVKAR